MKKRSSKAIQLFLISSVLASCNKPVAKQENQPQQKVFMRADSTAQYTNVTQQYHQSSHTGGMGNTLLWYMAFRHLGGGMGYASSGLNPNSVVGKNTAKANAYSKTTTRGGFGKSAYNSNSRVSS
ncbi:hypothetical protein H1R17_08895 [Flavobacterium sp. xlx-214]|uniref:hypothetical protein n=1 Tax=unclassified Flavobacterium TaxID=196869 RepID=UPI0013D2E8B4|nr:MULTISPECIES: hypothetical protein [unclassified Flavobacterium]MBA5793116.1 hypothetical protein [Flavobacterium sp. xlx-221]QMI82597.1 hypothetical protein H1R17_08895 [Flavobacterium sp. xlx-214]